MASRRWITGPLRHVARALGYGLVGGTATLVVVFVVLLERRPDLEVWHRAKLAQEFRRGAPVAGFGDYLALEERLWAELDAQVYRRVAPSRAGELLRFRRGSLADPARWERDWNRSYELAVDAPRAGALLVHGMSDSPYSLRSVALALHASGVHVVGLRVPGHGTHPGGLLDVKWEDMDAAVALAARHVREVVGERPVYLVGYSNGAALGLLHALAVLEDPERAELQGLALLSPEIGLARVAGLAAWQGRLGRVLGLDKLAWNVLSPEYDPFKYQSFPINAGVQAWRVTVELQARLARLSADGALERLPPVLAFQSVVDGTVSAPAVLEQLFARLPRGGHELVLFDVNRWTEIEPFLVRDPLEDVRPWLERGTLDAALTLVTNATEGERAVVARRWAPGAGPDWAVEEPLGVEWPPELYSLSHVALPFPPDDPLYGVVPGPENPGLAIGQLALRGEHGVLRVSAADMLRLRWNPFHAWMVERLLAFTGAEVARGGQAGR